MSHTIACYFYMRSLGLAPNMAWSFALGVQS